MPLFSRNRRAANAPVESAPPASKRSSGLFGRQQQPSYAQPANNGHHHNNGSNGGLFHRNRSVSPVEGRNSGGLLSRNHADPSIMNARERVVAAEAAEKGADRALYAAK